MKNLKILLLLGVMLVNMMPYVKDWKIGWNTNSCFAQTYTAEGMIGDKYKCVNTINPDDWYPSSLHSCQVTICACDRCHIKMDCDKSCQTTTTCDECLTQIPCGGKCPNPVCGQYNGVVDGDNGTSSADANSGSNTNGSNTNGTNTNGTNTTGTNTGTSGPPASSPSVVAPKAASIFRNGTLTDGQWIKIEAAINKMMLNCMGKSLYNNLKIALNGKTLFIEYSNENFFYMSSSYSKISLTNDFMSGTLLHEMFHSYQAYKETFSTYKSSQMNQEMEAWYVKYLYASQINDQSEWSSNIKNTRVGEATEGLASYVDSKGNNLMTNERVELYIMNQLTNAFKMSNTYKDYNLDFARSPADIFADLKIITKDC